MTSEESITLTRKEYDALIERNRELEETGWPLSARTMVFLFPTRWLSPSLTARDPSSPFGTTRASHCNSCQTGRG